VTRVSVVIPTYRRPELLARCLAALAEQDLPPDEYEVLVADDAASTQTRAQVADWAESHSNVHYLPVRGSHGPAAARNVGWRAARGEVIAFTDDDTIPDPGWLSAGLRAGIGSVAAISGRIVMPLPGSPTDYELNAAGLADGEFVTANCFVRRAALEAVGGFDERFTAAWREDSDLQFTLLERGYAMVRAEDAVVTHPVRSAAWGISLSQQQKSRFEALLYQKHPRLYRERIHPTPWRYYGTVASFSSLLLAALSGRPRLALGAAGLWVGLTTRFCLQRLARTSHAPEHVAEMVVTSVAIPFLSVFWRLRGALRYRVAFL
jgi:GT2 family glycosyltransferase